MNRKISIFTAAALALGFAQGPAIAQQYGPPSSGPTAAILFVPANLSPIAGGAETPTKVLNGAGSTGNGGLATAAQLDYPVGMAYDSSGNLFFADASNYAVRRIDHATGIITVFAGTLGTPGTPYTLGGGVATSATLGLVSGLTIDSSNNVYVADRTNQVVFKITSGGTISVFAGGGTTPSTCTGSTDTVGDGCLATQATINNVWGLGIDSSNNVYIADSYNELIRQVSATTSKISAYAGVPSDAGTSGACNSSLYTTSTGPWTPSQAHLCFPEGIAFDSNGNAFIAEAQHKFVREITKSTGNIAVFAGGGTSTADGVPATTAGFALPSDVYVDAANRVYISDAEGLIRVVDSSGNITTVMGNSSGELRAQSWGEPDTEAIFIGGQYTGATNGVDGFAMDIYGNIVATDSSGAAITSAGASGGGAYYFGNQQIYTTVTTTSLNAGSSFYPPYILISNPSGVNLNFTGTPAVTGPFAISGGTCVFPGTLTPGQSCTVVLSFTPIADVSYTGTVSLVSNTASSPNVINLSGAGTGSTIISATIAPNPVLISSPATVTSVVKDATVTNTSIPAAVPITITGATLAGTNPTDFAIVGTTCPTAPATLAGGATCYYQVTFTPPAASGYSAQLQVAVTGYGNLNTFLDGTGTAATPAATPVISPAGGTYNAPVAVQITDSSPSPTIYYTTTGTAPVVGTSPTYSGVFTVSTSGTEVQAIATATGLTASNAATPATYMVSPVLVFNPAAVGGTSPQQLTATFSLAGTTAPTASLHYGHDYTLGTLNCTPNVGIETCTVGITFVPTLPGTRKDALFLTSSGTRVATVLLDGVGQAPFGLIQPGVITQAINNAGNALFASTVDENGTAYILESSFNEIFKLTKAGVQTTLPITGLSSPRTISIDGAGVLYVHNAATDSAAITYDTVQGIQGTKPLPSSHFWAVGVGNAGNLYAVDENDGVFYAIKPDGTNTSVTLNPSIAGPSQLAVDSSENVFVGGATTNEITPSLTQTGFSNTDGVNAVLVDAAGTLYAAPYSGYGGLPELPATNYNGTPIADIDSTVPLTIGGGLGSDGTVFVGTQVGLDKVDRSHGAVSFGSQTANVASTAQIVSLYNGGNQNLTLSSFALSGSASGFAIQTAATSPCTNGMTIVPGALCNVSVTLTAPGAGTFSGSISFTTNTLNSANTIQQVSLSGFVYGINVSAAPNPLNFPNQVAGTSSGAQNVTLTNNGLSDSATILQPLPAASGYVLGIGTCAPSIAPGGTCNLSVTFDPTLAQAYDDLVSLTAESSGGGPNQTVTFNINGLGTPAPSPIASLSSSPIAFSSQVVGSTSAPIAVPLMNTGAVALNISNVTIIGTNPTDFAILSAGTNICGTTLAAGATCDIYIAFTPASATTFSATLQVTDNSSTGTTQTEAITGPGVTFSSNVGTAEAMQLVTINFTTAGTINFIHAFTQGIPNLDFTATSGGTCDSVTTVTVGQSCTVEVIFDPTAAGIRNGALVVTDASSNILGTAYLPGYGIGPEIAFGPAVQSSLLPTNTNAPEAVALDAARNLYLVDGTSSKVFKLPWNGTSYGAEVAIGSGYNEPFGVAVDGAGNVYVGNYAGGNIIKIPWNGTSYGTQTTVPLAAGSHQPKHLVVDGNGNIFFADYVGGYCAEVPWNGTSYGTSFDLPFTGINSPNSAFVDQNGDVFCVGTYTENVVMLPKSGSGFGSQVTVVGGLTGHPIGAALDAHGNVYVAVQGNGTNQGAELIEVPLTSGTTYGTPVTLPETSPTGLYDVALDGLGNVYTANFGTAQVYKLDTYDPPGLNFMSTNVGSVSSDSPKTATVTDIGNASLIFSDTNNPSFPTDFPVNGSATSPCTQGSTLNQNSTCNIAINFKPTTGGPLSENVVLADNDLNSLSATQSIMVSGSGVAATAPVASLAPSPVTFTGQVVGTTSEAIAVTLSNTGTATLTGITPSITGTNPSDFAITTGTNACTTTLAASSTCSIYVTFTPTSAASFTATLSVADNASGSPQTATLNGTGVAFSSNVGTAEAAQTVTVNITTAGTLNTIQVLTQGIASLDFTKSSGGTCTTTTVYTVGQTCTVNVIFTPRTPGARPGAVLLTDAGNHILGTAYLPGVGTGPEIVFSPGVQSTPPSIGYSGPLQDTVDAGLNIYVADTINSRIIKIPWNGSSYGTPFSLPFIGLNKPYSVAVDGSGNVFVADSSNFQVLELPWNGTSFGTQIVLDALALPAVAGIAVDGNGNLFFTDQLDQKLVEMQMTSSGYGTPTIITAASGLHAPHGVTVDSNLNVYIADSGDNRVVEIPWGGSSFGTEIVVPTTGLFYPQAVAVDAAGDVYIADTDHGKVVEVPWNGSSFGTQGAVPFTLPGTAITTGLAIDSYGNLYVVDSGDNAVDKLTVSTPPSLSFATTSVGSVSSDSPKTVIATNIGNASLYLNAATNNPVYPADFPINNADTNLCEEDNSLYVGGSCDVSVKFIPTTTGPLSENVVLTDNNLNGSNVTQSILVSGTGSGVVSAPTINWTLTTPITYGTALGAGDFNATVTASNTNISADGTFAYTITSVGGTTATAATILPGGADTLCVQWTPLSGFTSQYSTTSECLPIQVNPASTSVSWTPASPILTPAPLGAGQFNATASAGSTPVTADGTLTYYITTVGGTVASNSTVLPVGSNTLCAQWVPSSTYTADYNSSSTCTSIVVDALTTITWTPTSPITYPSTLGSGQFNASAFSGANNIGANGTFTYYVTSVGGTVANGSTVLPGGSDTLCVQWVPSSSFTTQYSSASQCSPIMVNPGATTISWTPSSATIIASSGPTAGQLDATALNAGEANVTADGAVTYHLSTVGGTVITTGASLSLGPVTICAVWAPSSSFTLDYIGSNACQNFTVINTQPTTTTVVTNASPVFLTTAVTFTATVTPTSGTIVPTGSVTFLDNGVSIGTGTLSPSGTGASATAKLTTSSLAAGTHPITVSYAGDTNNQSSTTAAALPEVIEDFTVSASSPSSTTIVPGTSATFTLVVSPLAPATTFPAAISLTATGLPTGATATFAPTSIASGAGSTTVTLTVTTPITTLARNQSPAQGAKWPLIALSLLLLPLAGKFRRAGRKWSRMLSILLLAAAGLTGAAAVSGCGGTPSGYFGQAQTTSTITVTGTSGALNHSATVTLTVE